MIRNCLYLATIIAFTSCGGNEGGIISKAKSNKVQTEKAVKPLPTVVNNRISIKRQFVPNEELEIFVLDLQGETFEDSKVSFVILDKNRDTLFSRKNIRGEVLLAGADDETDTEEEQIEYIIHKMSTFFSVKNFSSPPYTIHDPNSDDFNGDLKVWNEVEGDTAAVCFEFSLLPNGGSEVLVYSRLLDSIVVYDKSH